MAGRKVEACHLIQSAINGFAPMPVKPLMARCHAALARVADTTTERSQHLQQAEELFQTMGMAWDLNRLEPTKSSLTPQAL